MGKKCRIVFIDNLDKVEVAQRKFFYMILNNLKNIYAEKLPTFQVEQKRNTLRIFTDEIEFTMLHDIVILKEHLDEKEIEFHAERVAKKFDESIKTLFVVDLCLDSPNNINEDTGIAFAKKLNEKIVNANAQVAVCTGVPLYERVDHVQEEISLDVFHRALLPGDIFSNVEFIFEESRYKECLSKVMKEAKDNKELLLVLDLLINNPYQNTQYLGDLLMKAFLFCKGMDNA